MGDLDVDTRKRLFGVEFTGEWIRCMVEVEEIIDGMMAECHEHSLSCESWSECEDDEDDDLNEDDSEDENELDKENEEDVECKSWRAGTMPMDDRLSEKVFELCVRFLTQVFRQEEEGNSPLIHFCGVLGIDWENLRFREPGRFTPMLAGLIWVSRLLFLEYALPKRPYTTLNWPGREYYDDFGWRLEDIRRNTC
jgi:hypothetical protein